MLLLLLSLLLLSSLINFLFPGLSGVFGSLCLNRGLQLENAAPAALMRNVDIVFAFIFDAAFFDEHPTPLTLCGGFVVLLSTGGVALAKWWSSRRKESDRSEDNEEENHE